MALIAKPVIDKQFWILQENNRKVGNVEACAGGYQVKINNQVTQFKTIKMAAQRVNIEFESAPRITKTSPVITDVHGYPVTGRAYNPMWSVTQQLPVYTKTTKSKSWFAAGWYSVRRGRSWRTMLAPKLIVLQRYEYAGPFHSESDANDHTPAEIR
jgi:hypothetical protein